MGIIKTEKRKLGHYTHGNYHNSKNVEKNTRISMKKFLAYFLFNINCKYRKDKEDRQQK